MSVLNTVTANQQATADFTARVLRLRDHLVGARPLPDATIEPPIIGGMLGDIDTAAKQNGVVLNIGLGALAELEAAFGIA